MPLGPLDAPSGRYVGVRLDGSGEGWERWYVLTLRAARQVEMWQVSPLLTNCPACLALAGTVWPAGFGPLPPLHGWCGCERVPVARGWARANAATLAMIAAAALAEHEVRYMLGWTGLFQDDPAPVPAGQPGGGGGGGGGGQWG